MHLASRQLDSTASEDAGEQRFRGIVDRVVIEVPGLRAADDTVMMARAARRLRGFRGIVDRVGIDVPGHRQLDDTVMMARKAATMARAAAAAAAIPRNR